MELGCSPATADRRSRIIGGLHATLTVFVRLVVLRDRHARDRQRGRAHACDNSESSFARVRTH